MKTDAALPASGHGHLTAYGLEFEVSATGVAVWGCGKQGRKSRLMVGGTAEDFAKLVALLDGERDRMIAVIAADAKRGQFGDIGDIKAFEDLHDHVDANDYVMNGGDPLPLLANGVIGKGVEDTDPEMPLEKEAFPTFVNACIDAVSGWIGEGGLAEAAR